MIFVVLRAHRAVMQPEQKRLDTLSRRRVCHSRQFFFLLICLVISSPRMLLSLSISISFKLNGLVGLLTGVVFGSQ